MSSEVAAPGRRVVVNGREVPTRMVEGAFIGFQVPPGQSVVRVVYRPMSYWGSVAVALLAAIVLAVPTAEYSGREGGSAGSSPLDLLETKLSLHNELGRTRRRE